MQYVQGKRIYQELAQKEIMRYGMTIDLTGQTFGRLTVIEKEPGSRSRWICRCECGNLKTMYACHLKNSKSCGCLEKENRLLIGERTKKHGGTNSILYSKYCSMKARVHNSKYKYFNRYGGRGIRICDEWESSFESFREWAYQNGYDDNKYGYAQTLDRINVDGNYEPSNCRWITQKEQTLNRGCTKYIEYKGRQIPISVFCSDNGITYRKFVTRRMKKNESAEQILEDWELIHSKEYMSTKEAAAYYGVHIKTIHNWVKSGKLNFRKVQSIIMIPREQAT